MAVSSGIGLLGGTFNPIHNGHLAIARETRQTLALDRVIFIPSGDPPHKPADGMASAKARYEMVRLAIDGDPSLAISDVEVRRTGKSYTIDTIRLIQKEYGHQTPLYFLIGLDAFLEFPTWRDPETLLTLCSFVVLSRPGLSFQALSVLPFIPRLPQASLLDLDTGTRVRLDVAVGSQSLICLRLAPTDVSASDIRARIARGASTANLLPPVVESYILQHHIY
ncbi:MAG TPA: nicotinate-nucleotide adenylyltransferase [Nitrospira sp.]|nr:nicotinate-nucleotide adenylyltransferase [Nitrospira sp.]